jgi:hypothetical protein
MSFCINSRKYVEDKLINSEITDNFKKFTKTSDHILETLTTGLKLIQNHENTKSTDFNTLHYYISSVLAVCNVLKSVDFVFS